MRTLYYRDCIEENVARLYLHYLVMLYIVNVISQGHSSVYMWSV